MLGKKIIGGFFCALFLLVNLINIESLQTSAQTDSTKGEQEAQLQLYATSAVLLDGDSGRVLYGKNADVPMAMASTTKIMTCILVLEMGNLDDYISVSSYAASMPKVKLYVHKGEQYQVRDLLYSLMLESHNDSAVVLAEYIGTMVSDGKEALANVAEHTTEESKRAVEAFAARMNEKAVELGCKDTWFVTPNGLDGTQTITTEDGSVEEKEHHTTAEELAKIMAYCVKQSSKTEEFLKITQTSGYSFSANGRSFSCSNHNSFLTMMTGALSGKTGFTNKAGYCYVGALESEGRTFIVALLACGWPNNKSYKWSDTRELMEYGIENYFYRELTQGKEAFINEQLCDIPVTDGQTDIFGETAYVKTAKAEGGKGLVGLLLNEEEEVDVKIIRKKVLEAPVEQGAVIGKIAYSVGDIVYRVEDIIATEGIERISLQWYITEILDRFLLKNIG